MRNFDLKKYLAEGHLFEEEEKLQMTYKGDPVHLQISKFGGTSEKPNETVLFIAVGGKGKRGSKGSKNTLERRLKLLDQKVDKILFTDNDNITKEIKSFNKNDFKINLTEGKLLKENVDFPELEDEFEGAMDAMVVEPEVYLQDIIDASAEEIVSDDYYEIMNAVEQGVYSEDEAVKLAKAWAKEKLSNLSEGKLLNEAELTDDLVQRVAQAIADEFTAEDRELDLKYVITPNSIEAYPDGGGFDLDVNAGPNTPGDDWKDSRGFGIANYLGDYAGGSFVIRPEGDGHLVTNAASRNAKVAYITPEGEIEIISAEDSKADLGIKENKINESIAGYINLNPINMNNKTIEEKKQGYNDELDDSLGMKHGSKKQDMAQRRADSENMEKAYGDRKYSGDKSKDKGRKKMKKETMDSKLSEIEKAGKITTLEAQIEAISEMIESKNQRISMVTEDENLSELIDKKKMKEMQREVKILEKKKAGMIKMYEKMCGKKYVQEFFSSSGDFEKQNSLTVKGEEEFEEMNENKNKNIMKKSDLKEMIKSAFLEEADLNIKDETNMYDPVAEQVDVLSNEFLQDIQDTMKMYYKMDVDMDDIKDWVKFYYIDYNSEYDNEEDKKELVFDTAEREDFYMHLNPEADSTFPIDEAEEVDVEDNEKVDVDIEKDVEVDVDDKSTETDTVVRTELPGESKDVEQTLGLLTKAQQTAQALGDEKLTDQIGNTITYFTRAHVARQNESLNESIEENTFPMWNKIK